MKRVYIALLFLLPLSTFAQSGKIGFFLDVCRFQDFYLGKTISEIYFSIDGTSIVNIKSPDGYFHAAVNIAWDMRKMENGDSTFIAGDNLVLDWPEGSLPTDTTDSQIRRSLFYMQKLDLDPGKYLLRAYAEDKNATYGGRTMAIYEFVVEDLGVNDFGYSDVKWIASKRPNIKIKTRDDLLPLITNDAFINADSLIFYIEFYNIDKIISNKVFSSEAGFCREKTFYMHMRKLPHQDGLQRS